MRSRFWRAGVATMAAALAVVSGACGGGGGDEGATRQVLVDHSSDEFASFVLQNFPEKVTVHRGDTVEFKQTWTGEPHTVTGGTAVSKLISDGASWIDFFEAFEAMAEKGVDLPNPEDPGDATFGDASKAILGAPDAALREKATTAYAGLVALDIGLPPLDPASTRPFAEIAQIVDTESNKFFDDLDFAFGEDDQIAQNVGQPCYLEEGGPPEDSATPCADADQEQPAFTGRQSYYNSGVLPYEGEAGNKFTVKVADDAALGSFLFYCAVHGPSQRSTIEIVDDATPIPSQAAVNKEIRTETEAAVAPLKAIQRDAKDDLRVKVPGADDEVEGPFAGLPGTQHSAINEFLPKEISAKVGKPITWRMMGADHTISFDVPKYFPIMEFAKDGKVSLNPKIEDTAGGAVPYDPPDEGDDPDRGEDGIVRHDGGTYDGTGFWSSGLISSEPYLEYTMRITKPGTYAYACLLHPAMVGRIKVTA